MERISIDTLQKLFYEPAPKQRGFVRKDLFCKKKLD